MPLGKKVNADAELSRRQRAELRTTYGNKYSNMNLVRLRSRPPAAAADAVPAAVATTAVAAIAGATTTSLRRIASSFAHVSDVGYGSFAALPHEDSEEDAREERAEVLIRSQPFKLAVASLAESASTSGARQQDEVPCEHFLATQTRANERWNQIAATVSALFRVRRTEAHPSFELRRLREQRDLLESFTRPFLYEEGNAQPK
ncbi:uncharacterized protein LOC108606940 [Drosophila busckii]|uniref:uncharacterized protein LOC108606940 n=1 Tax=Drosophila busckii TaxID=30019 RepID=UPI00083EF45C|nr:uncharacterized protein LOC108606940 [Drosophila busckii]